MPDQQSQQDLYQALIERVRDVVRSSKRQGGTWSRPSKVGCNTVVFRLNRNAGDPDQFLISTEIEGRRKQYKGIELPNDDPQSDIRASSKPAAEVIHFFWKMRDFAWAQTASEDSIDVSDRGGEALSVDAIIDRLLIVGRDERRALICDLEVLHLTPAQQNRLAPILWAYILEQRDSNDRGELVAVGSAIRKYIAMLDVGRVGEVSALLESGHRIALSLDLELELAKMIYRKFEANPPLQIDSQPDLGSRLWEMAEAYLNPRVLLRDKHATVASLAIEALVAMRSSHAVQAYQAAVNCPLAWFGEMVRDNLNRLRARWELKSVGAATWCAELLNQVAE